MPEKIKYKLKPTVGKRQFYRRIALTVCKTFQTGEKKNNISHENIYVNNVHEKNYVIDTPENIVSTNQDLQTNLQLDVSSNTPDSSDLNNKLIISAAVQPCLNSSFNSSNLKINPNNIISQPCLNLMLKQWAVNCNVTHSTITSLLHILHPFHHELPLDSRTLLKTPRNTPRKRLNSGEFCYFGLKNVLRHTLSQIPENKFWR